MNNSVGRYTHHMIHVRIHILWCNSTIFLEELTRLRGEFALDGGHIPGQLFGANWMIFGNISWISHGDVAEIKRGV
jgi:hypothetical protein